jgi:hypothetical protein
MGNRDIRIATASKELLVRFRLVNPPGFGEGIDLLLRRFGIIRGVISGRGRAGKLCGIRGIVGKRRSNGRLAIFIVSVTGSDFLVLSVDGSPCVHGRLGTVLVTGGCASIEWAIVVKHRANTSKIQSINHIGMDGALLSF